MARLVALQHRTPEAMLRGLDAAWAAGEAALPLDPLAPDSRTADLVARLRPAELRTDTGAHPTGHDLPVPAGTALVVATSGSTGAPTGVVLSHAALAASTARSRGRLGAADGVPWLGVLPLHHVAGISVVLRSRAAGRAPSLHRRDTPEVLAAAEPSWISLVPTQLQRLLDAGVDLARHHGVLLGGAAASDGLLDRARAAGAVVVTSYGATETCGGVVYDGRPLADVEVRLDPDGRIALRTPTVATGTRRRDGSHPPVTDDDGWWRTSDLGQLVDGRLEVLGRADDVAVSGGENVPLGPVRAALAEVAADVGIADGAVVAMPDERWGTSVTAVAVARDGAALTLTDLRAALAPRLPRSHLPTTLVVGATLPRTDLGKVTPDAVRSAVARGHAEAHRLGTGDGPAT